MNTPKNNQTARTIAKQAEGWIEWNDARDCPQWIGSKIHLDGRFTADELRAILEFERKDG